MILFQKLQLSAQIQMQMKLWGFEAQAGPSGELL
jgi:hypothetical protein